MLPCRLMASSLSLKVDNDLASFVLTFEGADLGGGLAESLLQFGGFGGDIFRPDAKTSEVL